MRRNFYIIAAVLSLLCTSGAVLGQNSANDLTRQLLILQPNYPKAYFFRQSEAVAANKTVSFEQWDQTFSRLMGIEGKVLDEELPGRSERNIEFFTRFKRLHPDQMVLLHFNGVSRDPRFDTGAFFAGQWVYYNGATITADVPAVDGITDIHVSDPRLFATNIGRFRDKNEDIGLCQLDGAGEPDWNESEQVQLISVDTEHQTIRVRRGCYGTKPRAFTAGHAYAAAHMSDGPWGRHGNLLWTYNFSLDCPKDSAGRTCADVLAEDLARRFLPGGQLAAFDGLEFDVLLWQLGVPRPTTIRGPDCNADGKPDFGYTNGLNRYGSGVVEFCRHLQDLLHGTKLVLADGQSTMNQRAFGIVNGIESEGWPDLSDQYVTDWSGGLNRHFYWQAAARPPVLNYFNHKFAQPGDAPGTIKQPDVPFSIHRLVFAAAQFTDAAICYSYAPRPEEGETLGIWDELRMGTAHRLGWLGKPLGPPVRMAMQQPDLLHGEGQVFPPSFVQRCSGDGVRFTVDHGALRIAAAGKDASELRFRLHDVPCNGPDLFVSLQMHGDPMVGYPASVARLTWVGIAAPAGQLITRELPVTGMARRGHAEEPLDPASGAFVNYFANQRLGGETHNAYFVHPPYRGGVGYTFWEREVKVPAQAKLEFCIGMGERAPGRSDGVTFEVLVAPADGGSKADFTKIFSENQIESRWTPHTVPLNRWAGQTVRLRFVSDCGPKNNATTDHSYWGDVFVVGPEGRQSWTAPERFMTWTGGTDFTSSFYFREVKSRTVDLEFEVDGAAPVWITGITAHAAPDAICREFEHGVVLANPSLHDYAFDLAKLCPGHHFRRLQGSPHQDPVVNNGQPVGDTVTLTPRDGLFLVRE